MAEESDKDVTRSPEEPGKGGAEASPESGEKAASAKDEADDGNGGREAGGEAVGGERPDAGKAADEGEVNDAKPAAGEIDDRLFWVALFAIIAVLAALTLVART